jgi:hypothetical protein
VPARPAAAPRAAVHEETLPTAMAAPPPPAVVAEKKPDRSKKKQAQRRGSVAAPQESSLQSPSVGNLPQGETAKAAPPPPPGSPAASHRTARRARSEEVAAATPSQGDVEAARPQAVGGHVAQINFAPGPFRARILPAGQKRLAEIAHLAQNDNVRIRIVGYGTAPANGDHQQREFQSFNAALENAKAVGIELAKLGVPSDRIDLETSTDVSAPDHAEVYVEY